MHGGEVWKRKKELPVRTAHFCSYDLSVLPVCFEDLFHVSSMDILSPSNDASFFLMGFF